MVTQIITCSFTQFISWINNWSRNTEIPRLWRMDKLCLCYFWLKICIWANKLIMLFLFFYGWLYMTRSHRKLHSGRSRSSQYTAIAPLHREFTTHADKLISQRALHPHITQVLRRQATLWLKCFVFSSTQPLCGTISSSNQFVRPWGSMVRCRGFWGHTNTAGHSWPSPWFLVMKNQPPSPTIPHSRCETHESLSSGAVWKMQCLFALESQTKIKGPLRIESKTGTLPLQPALYFREAWTLDSEMKCPPPKAKQAYMQ